MLWEKIEGLGYVNPCTQLIFFIVDVLIAWGLWFFIFSEVFHVKILVSLFLHSYLIFWLFFIGLLIFHWFILLRNWGYELKFDHLSFEREWNIFVLVLMLIDMWKCEFELMKCFTYLGWGMSTHLHVNCMDYFVERVLVHPYCLCVLLDCW